MAAGVNPIPVSRTDMHSSTSLPSSRVDVTVTTTSPASVNLIAFDSRFNRIWRSRVTSPSTACGTSPSNRYARSRPRSAACRLARSSADSTHSRRSNGWVSMSIRPASILEKSRISLMIVSSASAESRIVDAYSCCSASSSVSSSRPLMPITAFIGVRISWLIVARNELLASFADSAAACASWASAYRRALRSATPTLAAIVARSRSCPES